MRKRLLFLFAAFATLVASAQTKVEIDGIWYNLDESTLQAEVTFKGDSYYDYDEYSGSITIPATVIYNDVVYSVTSIGECAFSFCRSLTDITLPEGVTSIGSDAFCDCSNLTSIIIPESVTSIGDDVFNCCYSLIAIVIPEGVTLIDGGTFSNCSSLTSINIPESVTNIGGYAFSWCTSLISITIPKGVTSIGTSSFTGCTSLTAITCKAITPPTIDDSDTFYNVDKSIPLYVPARSVDVYKAAAYWSEFTNYQPLAYDVVSGTCGDNLTWRLIDEYELVIEGTGAMYDYESGDAPWYDCRDAIHTITLPEEVTSIGEGAFENCGSLTAITIPVGVTSIGERAFAYCSNLTSMVVAEGNTTYDSRNNCNAIIETSCNTLIAGCASTIIPEDVTSIGNHAFVGSSLTIITLPEGVTSIGEYAFTSCRSLTDITIPEGVMSIGEMAFAYCFDLTSITIPEGVTSIGDWAFYCCFSLTTITCYAVTPPAMAANYNTFSNVSSSTPLYVPAGSVEAYQLADGWSKFTNILPLAAANEYTLSVSAAGYATLFLDYAAEIPNVVEVFYASSVEDDRLKMTKITGVLPAGTGVIVRAAEGTYTFTESDETPESIEGNLLVGTTTKTLITTQSGYAYYVLANVEGVAMYKPSLTDRCFYNNANKAYLVLKMDNLGIFDDETNTEDEGGQLSNRLRFDFGGTTSIDHSEFIIHNSELVYDLHGRRITDTEGLKGIYIVNGKKVVIK